MDKAFAADPLVNAEFLNAVSHLHNENSHLDEAFKLPLKNKRSNDLVDLERGDGTANIQNEFGICGWILTILSYILIFFTLPISACMCIKVVQEYERAVIFRLGRLLPGGAKGPGIFFVVPCIDTYRKVDLRVLSFEVPPQEILSKDSVTVAVDAVVYFRISNATISVTNVEDSSRSTKLLAQTTLRNILGTKTLAEMLSDREAISLQMQATLDEATEPWGVKVERVEVKDVRLPVQLQRAMAAEAEAAREARAKVIVAEGEQKASRALKEAAEVIAESPSALQLRYLQTLNSISAEKNSTIIFPFPIDLLSPFFCRTASKQKPPAPNPPQRKVRACCLYKYPEWMQDILTAAGAVEGVNVGAPSAANSGGGPLVPSRRESSSAGCTSSSYMSVPPTNRSGTVSTASARDFMFRPSLTESGQSVGARTLSRDDSPSASTSRESAVPNILWDGGVTAARRTSRHSLESSADASTKNTGHTRSSSQSGASNTQNMLLRKAIANRMTRQPTASKIPVPSCLDDNNSTRKTPVLKARIVLADTPPIIERIKRGNVDYEVPPHPTSIYEDKYSKKDVNSKENVPNTSSKSEPDAMIASLLANAAWYRDIDGRTGFVPNEWRSAPNIQESAVKMALNGQQENDETRSDITWRAEREGEILFDSSIGSYAHRPIIRETRKSNSVQRMKSAPPETDGCSSSSEASRQSHKSVTFASKVTEICAKQSPEDELQSLLHILRLANREESTCKNDDETDKYKEKQKKNPRNHERNINKSAVVSDINPMASMPPLPPPRSPKNIRYARNTNSSNTTVSPSKKTKPHTIIRSASGYLADNSVIVQQVNEIITRPNNLENMAQRRSRSFQNAQLSYYDNVTPPYPDPIKHVEFTAEASVSESDDDYPTFKLSKLKKLPAKAGGRHTRKDSRISSDNCMGTTNPLLRHVTAIEAERRDSMLDSDSRESVISATSLHVEKHLRDIYE